MNFILKTDTKTGNILVVNNHCSTPFFKLVYIQEGKFRDVYNKDIFIKPFFMGECLVTQKLFIEILDYNPSFFNYGDERPVENIYFDQVETFCEALNKRTEFSSFIKSSQPDNSSLIKSSPNALKNLSGFRLPTLNEWLYAFSLGNRKKMRDYSDVNVLNEEAWFERNSNYKTQPVAQKKANDIGLYDMLGNVWELIEGYDNKYDHGFGDYCPESMGGAWSTDLDAFALRPPGCDFWANCINIGFRVVLS